ncbi:hypothetical protein PF011_g15330 [Phytophthora fragariae]|uniref:RxLR effector PexRD54 WY domain-containing protein n=3 Tax=Phytophthora fragariae TaxID=53985 RepID=A0A6A3JWX3_9STRA|nr:hypothetical protein PF011_g15330 [Phytophthora fragariae]
MEEEDNSSGERGLDKIPGVAKLADMLTPDKQKAANKLFSNLKLHETTANLFESPKFHKWVKSVTKSYKKTPDTANAVIVSTIMAQHGDEALARMLAAAKQTPTTQLFATQLEEVQLANWLTSKRTADDVFKLLKLDDEGVNLFKNPVFSTWVSYATKLDDKNPDTLMFSVLKARYDDDVLADIFIAAKETRSTRRIAARQESILFAKWTSDGKTADDAFKLLKLNPNRDDFLKSPALDFWISYVKMLGEDPYKLILATLPARYTDEGLASMLVVAKQDHITVSVAAKLEDALFNRWLAQGKSAESVFKLLNLNKAEDKIFESPMLRTWASYVRTLDKMNPDEAMFSVLKTRYGDEVLTDMLIASRKSGTARYDVSGLEEVLLKTWVSDGKTADDIFKLLRLDKDGDKVFESLNFDMWVSYVTKLDKKNPDKLMLSVLKTRYNDDRLQSMIITAQKVPQTKPFAARMQDELWISEGKTADDIFQLLKLNRENMFDSGELSTWVSYVTKLNKLDDRPDEFAVISELQERFGNAELAMMISAALIRSDPNKNIIKSLQTLQFKRWLAEGITPKTLAAKLTPDTLNLPGEAPILLSNFDYRITGVTLNYYDFYRANT